MNTTVFRSLAAASAVVALMSVAKAATVLTTEAAFLSWVSPSPYYVETFNDEALADGLTDPVAFSNGTYSYTISTSGASDTFFDGVQAGASVPSDSVTINFTSGNVKAVGANFYAVDASGTFVSSQVTVTLSDGTTLSMTPTLPGNTFRGFASVGATVLTSVTLSASQANGFKWATLDNLTVGVPEPATYACLLGMSVLGFVVVNKRKPTLKVG